MQSRCLVGMSAVVFLLVFCTAPGSAAPKNTDLIVGKWDPGMNAVIEYKKDGTMSISVGKDKIDGKYKFLDEDTIEIELPGKNGPRTNKLKVAIKDDELTTTDPDGKTTRLKRVK